FPRACFRPPARRRKPGGTGLVADLLGQLVPPDAVPDPGADLPLHGLVATLAEGPDRARLLGRLEAPSLGQQVVMGPVGELRELVEVHRDGPPPPPAAAPDS